jgi:cell division protein FtsQ
MARRRPARAKRRPSKRRPPRTRRTRRSALPLFRALAALGLLALLGYGAWAVRGYLESTFEIRQVEVTGNRDLSSARVLDMSGISHGANLLWTSLGKARERLESDLRIKSASLSRDFPDKVTIEIVEREPFAVLVSPTGRHLVDLDGVIFSAGPTNDESSAGLPTILLNSSSKEGEWASCAVACLRAGADSLPGAAVETEVSASGSFTLWLDSGLSIRLGTGSASDLREKIGLAAEILRRDSRLLGEAEYIDLSCPGAPACKMKGEGDGPASPGG